METHEDSKIDILNQFAKNCYDINGYAKKALYLLLIKIQ